MIDPLLRIDTIANLHAWRPYYGWHDDHQDVDHTPDYLPALQQVRDEFADFLDVLREHDLSGSCLQLGVGATNASHEAWRAVFDKVVSIDRRVVLVDGEVRPGCDTQSAEALTVAEALGPYDLVFIDAGHGFEDVQLDHQAYGPLVRPGGIIAFHDAVRRRVLPSLEVWLYLRTLIPAPEIIGNRVGIAWIEKT